MNLFWLNHSVRPRKLTLLEAQKLLEQKIAQRLHPDNLVVSPQFPYDDLFTKGRAAKKSAFFPPTFSNFRKVTATFCKGTLVSGMTYGPFVYVLAKQF